MFKRIIIAVLCVLAVAASMTGCTGQNSTQNNTESESISSTENENNELSSDEALKIAKEYWKRFSIEENGYLVAEAVNKDAPENFYVFVLKHLVQIGDSSYYSTIDEVWVDRFTGEARPPFDAKFLSVNEAIRIADEYWGCINGKTDAACGTTLLCRIVVSNDPTPVFPFYRLVWQIEHYSNCGSEGYEDGSPYIIETYKEVLVNIYTGECCADTQPDEKG